jgi:hypothetical protein
LAILRQVLVQVTEQPLFVSLLIPLTHPRAVLIIYSNSFIYIFIFYSWLIWDLFI